MTDDADTRARLLDAAEELFYARGVQAVGMDELRAASGLSLKRLYRCFASKNELVAAYLRRRDARWRADLAAYVTAHAATPDAAPLAVFDWLHAWFAAPGFRGCAFVNAVGELGPASADVTHAAREHKRALHAYLTGLVRPLGVADPAGLATQLAILVDGAISNAALTADPCTAPQARAAAHTLLTTTPHT
ncbi:MULTISPECIES: TetR/AcrR family transcriptional regulator [Streptomyces]|uniref:TetR/AcrR family transcriptional regulator n=1 Tax=Streptomyces TaxID=1883 RepID=UPI00224957F4|nr:TetR/AcrR family transcriptional regulator [Streptomyces sp. JHD 1]MCX2971066.1 helix-turn-helix domain containing protein [Streptomyces sp. JHD 1]